MITVASVTSTTGTESSGIPMTKPTGLASGDLMVCHIGYGTSNDITWTLPSGWTQTINRHNSSSSNIGTYVFWKIADSGDAAASNFTFTPTGSSVTGQNFGGGIYRITGYDAVNPIGSFSSESKLNDSNPVFNINVTPLRTSSLLLFFSHERPDSTSISGYSTSVSNPSWTEAYDLTPASGNNVASAYAVRTELTNTGTFSITGGGSSSDWAAALLSITPAVLTVTTQAASSVLSTTATANGNITDIGQATPDKRGTVYDTVSRANPGNVAAAASGYASNVEASGSFSAGAFTSSLTSLTASTVYYARAYAHNSDGYIYGDEIMFLTSHAANSPVTTLTNPTLGETAVWRNRILYGLDQPNTTYNQNDDVGGVWMLANSEPGYPLTTSLYFMVSATSAAPYRPWGVRVGGMYADQTNTIKVAYQDTQATATSAQYHIGTLDTVYTGVNSQYAYYLTLPINCDSDAKKIFHSIRPTVSGPNSATMGIRVYYRLDVDSTSLYDNNINSVWTLLGTVTTSTKTLTMPVRKTGRNIQFKFVFVPESGFSPQLLDYTLVYDALDQYR